MIVKWVRAKWTGEGESGEFQATNIWLLRDGKPDAGHVAMAYPQPSMTEKGEVQTIGDFREVTWESNGIRIEHWGPKFPGVEVEVVNEKGESKIVGQLRPTTQKITEDFSFGAGWLPFLLLGIVGYVLLGGTRLFRGRRR